MVQKQKGPGRPRKYPTLQEMDALANRVSALEGTGTSVPARAPVDLNDPFTGASPMLFREFAAKCIIGHMHESPTDFSWYGLYEVVERVGAAYAAYLLALGKDEDEILSVRKRLQEISERYQRWDEKRTERLGGGFGEETPTVPETSEDNQPDSPTADFSVEERLALAAEIGAGNDPGAAVKKIREARAV